MSENFNQEIPKSSAQEPMPDEPVWTYRGYRIKSSEFVTAMVHFFRAEVQRANVWRQRLDATTNWAVISTGATLSIAYSQTTVHHTVILLNILLVSIFLYIEGRRYRYYELWSYRVRLMETDFFAAMLVPPFHPSPDWAEGLAEALLNPSFPISIWEAIGRRLRRNYIWIFLICGLAWFAKYWLFPAPPANWEEVISRASIGNISGSVVILFNLIYFILLIVLAIITAPLQHSSGEVLPRFNAGYFNGHTPTFNKSGKTHPWYSYRKKRQQFIAFIITDQAEEVSQHILSELNRGVTAVEGKGMYTSKDHSVLMCAITTTEINNLKKIVSKADPRAFIIISPAQEILGRGFSSLVED
jgi:uncharacterized membrane protein